MDRNLIPRSITDPSGAWANLEAGLLPPELMSPEQQPAESPVERLLHTVDTHAAAEADSLVEYRQLADTAEDPVVALLLRLVLEDEERHHGLLHRISASLNDSLRWTHSRNALPAMSEPPPRAPMAQVVASVREFIRQEHQGVRHLKELAQQSKRLNGGLDSLLLETMVLDSQKHERILRFILERLQTRVDAATG